MSRIPSSDLYTDVNLLPAWYRAAADRRAAVRRQIGLLSLMLVVMVVMLLQTYRTRMNLQSYYETVAEQAASTQRQVTEVQKLEKARVTLAQQLRVHRDLHQPITYSQIAGTLSSLMPEPVALRTLQMRNDKVTTTRPASSADKKPADGKSDKKLITDTHVVVQIELEGIAPSDVEVANFIGALAGSRLFQNVKLHYAKQGVGKSGKTQVVTREFKVRMEVPLNLQYKAVSPEVARAH